MSTILAIYLVVTFGHAIALRGFKDQPTKWTPRTRVFGSVEGVVAVVWIAIDAGWLR